MATLAEIFGQDGGSFDNTSNDFDILFNALETANLDGALDAEDADLTVFAPTDAAFITLAQDLGFQNNDEAGAFDAIVAALTPLGDGDPLPLLRDILLYHVSPEEKELETIQGLTTITTLLPGATITPNGDSLIDLEPDLVDPSFISFLTNQAADNGIFQVIDRVLSPLDIASNEPPIPTIAGIVAQSGEGFDNNNQDFDILLTALQTAGLVEALDDADTDLNVFAPTDAAFVALAQDFGFSGDDEAGAFDAIAATLTELGDGDPIPLLTDILLYHVSPGVNTDGTIATLLTNATITAAGNRLIDNEPDLSDPTFIAGLTDIQAANGTIQGIDRVLIPLNIPDNGEDTTPPVSRLNKVSENTLLSTAAGNAQVNLVSKSNHRPYELGIYTVDDDLGLINGIAPGEAGYIQAATQRFQSLFSTLSNSPNGFNNDIPRTLSLEENQNLRFYLLPDGTVDTLNIGTTALDQIIFPAANTLQIEETDPGQFTLSWETEPDTNNFDDLVVSIQTSDAALPLGTGLQGRPNGELIDLRDITGQAVNAEFTLNREAALDNFIGFYTIADETGGIDTNGDGITDIRPGAAGYAQAALSQRLELDLTVENQATTKVNQELLGGSILAPFIIINDGPEVLLDTDTANDPDIYFAFVGANSDGADHIRLLGDNTFGFEDLSGGGDQDFNDVIVQAQLTIA
ncbi:fasciclin domain-containing protein [Leptothoe kymatousa]|uniref:Fasciclin domain-containing protein n=1 Tax=Leptothoe kymatousa TAU-MAC 1615 TaxID=2364775 RepID=A0ABS5Y1V1_9CYAN|nr:fasciclin domain-containing protein [Leptothoe kymatousa]MBT9311808.1 fasciclin domain-containing protein [Leptothoe kymatousa TAU-MAC 1615]